MRKPIATWNPARDVWETGQQGFLCEHSAVYSATWPTSGMTRSGSAFELPTWEPPTPGSGTSLLPTPEAKLSDSGPDYARASRPGSVGDDLTTALHRLLPTPMSRDHKAAGLGSDMRRNSPNLPAITQLLPTPTAADQTSSGGSSPAHTTLTDATVRTRLGARTNPRFTDGNESQGELPLDLG